MSKRKDSADTQKSANRGRSGSGQPSPRGGGASDGITSGSQTVSDRRSGGIRCTHQGCSASAQFMFDPGCKELGFSDQAMSWRLCKRHKVVGMHPISSFEQKSLDQILKTMDPAQATKLLQQLMKMIQKDESHKKS